MSYCTTDYNFFDLLLRCSVLGLYFIKNSITPKLPRWFHINQLCFERICLILSSRWLRGEEEADDHAQVRSQHQSLDSNKHTSSGLHLSMADRTSIIYGDRKYTWAQTMERCRRLAAVGKTVPNLLTWKPPHMCN